MRSTRIYDAFGSIAINKTDPAILNLKESANGGGRGLLRSYRPGYRSTNS